MRSMCRLSILTILVLLVVGVSVLSASEAISVAPTPQSAVSDPILQKVLAKYQSLTSYAAKGTSVSIIDMSKVDMLNMPGMTPERRKQLAQIPMYQKPQTLTHTFSIKLGRPDYYLIQWEQKVHANFTNSGAVWSAGEGNYISLPHAKEPQKLESKDLALAMATGVSGGAANTIPVIFFNLPSNPLKLFTAIKRQKDEKVDGDDCYVYSGSVGGMSLFYWISKDTLLIRQRRQILGSPLVIPKLSDEDVKKTLRTLGKEATTQAVQDMKHSMEAAQRISSQVKGSITETHRNIQVNFPVTKEQFQPKPPTTQPAPATQPETKTETGSGLQPPQ